MKQSTTILRAALLLFGLTGAVATAQSIGGLVIRNAGSLGGPRNMYRVRLPIPEVVAEKPEPGLVKVVGELKFPEGPAYDGKGNIYCSNCNADYITKVTAGGQVSISHRANTLSQTPFTFKKTNGMTFYKDGSLFVCDFGRNAIVRIYPDGKQEVYADNCDGKSLESPNDLAFDPSGNLYFTAPGGSSKANPNGSLYRCEADTRKVTKVGDGFAFPNGLAFSADAKSLYMCESQHNWILRFPVLQDGTLGPKQVFADLSSDGPGEPDGMAVDSGGNLWIAHYGTHHLLVVNPKGLIIRTIRLPHIQDGGPTNVEFAGKDLQTLYITDPGSNALYKLRVKMPGLPLFSAPLNTGK